MVLAKETSQQRNAVILREKRGRVRERGGGGGGEVTGDWLTRMKVRSIFSGDLCLEATKNESRVQSTTAVSQDLAICVMALTAVRRVISLRSLSTKMGMHSGNLSINVSPIDDIIWPLWGEITL